MVAIIYAADIDSRECISLTYKLGDYDDERASLVQDQHGAGRPWAGNMSLIIILGHLAKVGCRLLRTWFYD
jgi:hypothetical protein